MSFTDELEITGNDIYFSGFKIAELDDTVPNSVLETFKEDIFDDKTSEEWRDLEAELEAAIQESNDGDTLIAELRADIKLLNETLDAIQHLTYEKREDKKE